MLRKILPHLSILLSNMYIVFFLIDRVNGVMAFINNNLTKWLLVAASVVSIVNSIILIHAMSAAASAAKSAHRAGAERSAPMSSIESAASRGRIHTNRSRRVRGIRRTGRRNTYFTQKMARDALHRASFSRYSASISSVIRAAVSTNRRHGRVL